MPAPSAPADPHERERRDLAHQALWIVRGLLVLVGTMPWWLPVVKGSLGPVGVILDALYIVICHRDPGRTLDVLGTAMPVCSRCAGIFSGLALGAAGAGRGRARARDDDGARRTQRRVLRARP